MINGECGAYCIAVSKLEMLQSHVIFKYTITTFSFCLADVKQTQLKWSKWPWNCGINLLQGRVPEFPFASYGIGADHVGEQFMQEDQHIDLLKLKYLLLQYWELQMMMEQATTWMRKLKVCNSQALFPLCQRLLSADPGLWDLSYQL